MPSAGSASLDLPGDFGGWKNKSSMIAAANAVPAGIKKSVR